MCDNGFSLLLLCHFTSTSEHLRPTCFNMAGFAITANINGLPEVTYLEKEEEEKKPSKQI